MSENSINLLIPDNYLFDSSVQFTTTLFNDSDWQIGLLKDDTFILIITKKLYDLWLNSNLINQEDFTQFEVNTKSLYFLKTINNEKIYPFNYFDFPKNNITNSLIPTNISTVKKLIQSYKNIKNIDSNLAIHDGIIIEKLNIILPTFTINSHIDNNLSIGLWLTGGINVSIDSERRIRFLADWISDKDYSEIMEELGLKIDNIFKDNSDESLPDYSFTLPGRPYLEKFFNEYVIDIVKNEESYKTMGIEFPSATILYGPPGTGKTFAVESLANYLGWPIFQIDSSTVGSSYIHGTSVKISKIFDLAIKNAPSVLIIDEMESFLADRDMGSGSSHHRVEEVAEFLRRIPDAIKNKVLIIAMTNRIDMIDPAILRRGRFDHHIKVDLAGEAEISSLLKNLISKLPHDKDINIPFIADKLKERPLSDVTFMVREAARLAAKDGLKALNQECCLKSIEFTLSR